MAIRRGYKDLWSKTAPRRAWKTAVYVRNYSFVNTKSTINGNFNIVTAAYLELDAILILLTRSRQTSQNRKEKRYIEIIRELENV